MKTEISNRNSFDGLKRFVGGLEYSLDWRTDTVPRVFVRIGKHWPAHRATSGGHSPKR